MNVVTMTGRLTDDPEIKYTTGEKPLCIASYSIAVNRPFTDKDGNRQADFFTCKSFGKTGEFIEKYFKKGMKIALVGRLEQERWEKDGKKNSRVVINAERVEFGESKAKPSEESKEKKPEKKPDADGFMPMTDEELPFN